MPHQNHMGRHKQRRIGRQHLILPALFYGNDGLINTDHRRCKITRCLNIGRQQTFARDRHTKHLKGKRAHLPPTSAIARLNIPATGYCLFTAVPDNPENPKQ